MVDGKLKSYVLRLLATAEAAAKKEAAATQKEAAKRSEQPWAVNVPAGPSTLHGASLMKESILQENDFTAHG